MIKTMMNTTSLSLETLRMNTRMRISLTGLVLLTLVVGLLFELRRQATHATYRVQRVEWRIV